MYVKKLIASCAGIGFIKGGGSIAAAVTAILWWLAFRNGYERYLAPAAALFITITGIWCGNSVERDWGKDSSKVVIDEVSGMCISLLFVPAQAGWIFAGFVLFRAFDIAKPLFIRKAERLPGGWGVMADDVLAGVYSNLLLQAAIGIKTWQHL